MPKPAPDVTSGPAPLSVGDPAPWFRLPNAAGAEFALDAVAGRYIVLCFYGHAADPVSAATLAAIPALAEPFASGDALFLAIGAGPAESSPALHRVFDNDAAVAERYGLVDRAAGQFLRCWFVLDPGLRVMASLTFAADGSERPALARFLASLSPMATYDPGISAPLLFLANVFERALCDRLVALFTAEGGSDSGFYADVGGETRSLTDYGVKRRSDFMLRDAALLDLVRTRIHRRVVPEIARAFQSRVSRLERPVVACYDSAVGGHFQAHRDNTSQASAHRRFAVSLNLNDDFEGGDLTFPEFGRRAYRPPAGGAIVFSCGLLHAVAPMRRGRRYAFLPFLHDEAGR
jgi:peroxiredoxin